ncbi:hypothetical protein PTKIN_Ptkin02bG0175300 [Pterospermum kingtungense]
MEKFSIVIWAIWRQRNDVVWRNEKKNVQHTVFHALDFLCNWLYIRSKLCSEELVSAPGSCFKWHVLVAIFVTCNVDASFFMDLRRQANEIAHASCSLASLMVWHQPPTIVANLLGDF